MFCTAQASKFQHNVVRVFLCLTVFQTNSTKYLLIFPILIPVLSILIANFDTINYNNICWQRLVRISRKSKYSENAKLYRLFLTWALYLNSRNCFSMMSRILTCTRLSKIQMLSLEKRKIADTLYYFNAGGLLAIKYRCNSFSAYPDLTGAW